jgi:hypothetical protein
MHFHRDRDPSDSNPLARRRPSLRRLRALLLMPVAVFIVAFSVAGTPSPANAASTGTVSGVVRVADGTPVKRAVVVIAGLTGITDATGAYSIANVPFGGHPATVTATCRAGKGFIGVDGNEKFDLFLNEALSFDDFGHVCHPFGTNFAQDPLVSTKLALVGDDESQHVTLPFSVPFYGSFKSLIDVSTNGYVTFDGASSVFSNVALSDSTAPADAIYAFWDDLVVDQLSAVRTGVRGSPGQRIFKIRWENVRFNGTDSGSRLTIDLGLAEDGAIDILWFGVDSNRERGDSATIGIKGPASSPDPLQQSFNAPTLEDSLGVEYVENRPPAAIAGPDQKVDSGKSFTLDGSASFDPDALSALTFRWTETNDPRTVIADPNKAKTTVNGVTGPRTLTYRLTVTDQFGRTTTDDITITVTAPK